jgi:flagellar hook-basal body complex protein FliE
MSDFRVAPVGSSPPLLPKSPVTAAPGAAGGAGFGGALREALDGVNRLQHAADLATEEFAVGKNRDVAGTLISIEKANLSFQLTMQIRSRLLEAYQEILRMPI